MRYARFDPVSGIAGNMILGALVGAGLSPDDLRADLETLMLPGWDLSVTEVLRGGLSATLVEVECDHSGQPERHLSDIETVISKARGLDPEVRRRSVEVFRLLASVEGRIHDVPPESILFHEIGAVDTIIDVVGSFAGLARLGVERVLSTPVAVGRGTVECEQGILPIPSPATVEILRGAPVVEPPQSVPGMELTTPTGAAILVSLVDDWYATVPPGIMLGSGMGAGSREGPGLLNVLRLLIAEPLPEHLAVESGAESDTIIEITAILDDVDMRTWPEISESLMHSGALDCYVLSGTGRKGRPCLEMTVLAAPDRATEVQKAVFSETTTTGIRAQMSPRLKLPRTFVEVETSYGPVSVKLAILGGSVVNAEPETEDCSRLAAENGLPARRVLREAQAQAAALLGVSADQLSAWVSSHGRREEGPD